MTTVTNQTRPSTAEELIGTWRRFGETGPVYQVLHVAPPPQAGGDQMAKIRVVETGEELDYRMSRLLCDPPES